MYTYCLYGCAYVDLSFGVKSSLGLKTLAPALVAQALRIRKIKFCSCLLLVLVSFLFNNERFWSQDAVCFMQAHQLVTDA